MNAQGSWYRMKWDDENPEDFADIHYGSLESGKSDNPARNFFVPSLLCYGDYSGSTVERANWNVFRDEFGTVPGVYELRGDFGSRGFALVETLLSRECDETYEDDDSPVPAHECECDARHAYAIREFLTKLDDYPVADDDELSKVEMESEQENWNSWGRKDFIRELRRVAGNYGEAAADAVDEADDDAIDALFYMLAERANVYPVHEGAESCYWDLERVAAAITLDELRPLCGAALVEVRKLRVRGVLPGNVEAAEYSAVDGEGHPITADEDEDFAPIVVVAASEADAVAYFGNL